MRLAEKVAVVTGGAGGIGRAVAEAMAAEGAAVVVLDLDADRAQQTAADIESDGGVAIGCGADVSKRADVEAAIDEAANRFDIPSVAYCSAGITSAGGAMAFLDIAEEEFDRVLAVNVRGTLLVGQSIARRLVAAKRPGSIVNVASVGSDRPSIGAPAYHTSKGAVVSLTRAMAVNLAHHHIRVNAISPGYIMTDMLTPILGDRPRYESMLGHISMNRTGEPAEIARAAVFLASDDASYITGEILHVDGGFSAHGIVPSLPPTFEKGAA